MGWIHDNDVDFFGKEYETRMGIHNLGDIDCGGGDQRGWRMTHGNYTQHPLGNGNYRIRVESEREKTSGVSARFFNFCSAGAIKAGTGYLYKVPETGNFWISFTLTIDDVEFDDLALMQNGEG